MPEDRLHKDYDVVENLSDLIEAREGRDSALADDVDAMEDIDLSQSKVDPQLELGYPHHHDKPSEEHTLGIDVELMDTPNEKEIEFDWQDSAEEMLPSDPSPNEGMGADDAMEAFAHPDETELTGPVPSAEVDAETGTAATKEEQAQYDIDGGEKECRPEPVPLEGAMETDSDEEDFRIVDRFEGQMDPETARDEMEEIGEAVRDAEKG